MTRILERALRPSRAAAYAGVSRSCLYRWWRSGVLTRYRRDGHTVYRCADLDRIVVHRPKRGRPFTRSS